MGIKKGAELIFSRIFRAPSIYLQLVEGCEKNPLNEMVKIQFSSINLKICAAPNWLFRPLLAAFGVCRILIHGSFFLPNFKTSLTIKLSHREFQIHFLGCVPEFGKVWDKREKFPVLKFETLDEQYRNTIKSFQRNKIDQNSITTCGINIANLLSFHFSTHGD